MRWLDSGFADVLALERFTPEGEDPSVLVVVNTSECSVTLPTEWGIDLLVTSGPEVAVVNEGGQRAGGSRRGDRRLAARTCG